MAYEDTAGHLLAEFERIDRLLEGYRATIERRGGPSQPVDPDPTPPADPASLPLAVPEDVQADIETMAATIADRAEASVAAGTTLRIRHVVETFDLSDRHRDVLLLALLPAAYPAYQEVYAELQNDLSATQPTGGLIADLFSETDGERLAATALVDIGSPLRDHDLIRLGQPDDTRLQRSDRPVFVADHVESYLLGHDGVDPVLNGVLERVPADASLAALRLDDTVRDRLDDIAGATGDRRLYWHGPSGTGKHRAEELVGG